MTETIKFGNRTIHVVIDKNMKSHDKDPFIIRKKEEAEAFLKKHGVPAPYRKSRR
jgi:hypothetical protein